MSKSWLNNGEIIILQDQCTGKTKFSFFQGQLYLTNQRIVLMQITRKVFEIKLDKIIEVTVEKKEWILGARIKQLCVVYKFGKQQRHEYMGIKKPEIWSDKIKESMTLMLMEGWGE